jgi:hypothetical protein
VQEALACEGEDVRHRDTGRGLAMALGHAHCGADAVARGALKLVNLHALTTVCWLAMVYALITVCWLAMATNRTQFDGFTVAPRLAEHVPQPPVYLQCQHWWD